MASRLRRQSASLVYLAGVAKGRYLPSAAAIIEDHPESLTFGVRLMPIDAAAIGTVNAVALDPATRTSLSGAGAATDRTSTVPGDGPRRIRLQMHPLGYAHRELLDAAHIVSYAEGGTHQVTNGLAFCKIHHAAYDSASSECDPTG